MRIGQITGEYPPMQGGVGAFTEELSKALIALGHEVFVFTDHRAGMAGRNGRIHVTADAHSWGWGTLTRIRHWARANALDVVNIQYQAAAFNMAAFVHILPMRLDNARVVTTFHDLLVPYLFPKAGPLRYQAVLTLARSSDGVIVTNRGDRAHLLAQKALINLRHIPIGSNIQPEPPPDYDRAAWRDQHDFTPSDVVIGYFGFLNASKGIDTLLHSLHILRGKGLPVKLLMIGGRTGTSDPANIIYAREVDEMIENLNLIDHVRWTGFVDNQAVSGYLMASDLIALPYRDGVSFRRGSLMAALAHGCTIVTTNPIDELPELVGDVHVRLVPPDSPTALAIALEDLADNPDLCAQMGRNARQLAAEFTWERIAAQTADYYRELIEQPQPQQP
ncbi:MAG: glycosyltransferase family 4 protein [Chloroflexi bacterium]|nr:glycosyltransferase family 4 protein [Chloroflexota bacterium]